jgi:hypothetical protein
VSGTISRNLSAAFPVEVGLLHVETGRAELDSVDGGGEGLISAGNFIRHELSAAMPDSLTVLRGGFDANDDQLIDEADIDFGGPSARLGSVAARYLRCQPEQERLCF